MADTITFTATGSPQVISRAIEEYARGQGHLTAIVVPWESDKTTLSMAVTAVKSDGWAIEHTNLGTIKLIDAGQERTEVAIREVRLSNGGLRYAVPISIGSPTQTTARLTEATVAVRISENSNVPTNR